MNIDNIIRGIPTAPTYISVPRDFLIIKKIFNRPYIRKESVKNTLGYSIEWQLEIIDTIENIKILYSDEVSHNPRINGDYFYIIEPRDIFC